MIKRLWRKYGINPFDRILRKAQRENHNRFLICWNRGLGDIALGLYALVYRIRHYIPDAEITFFTRENLKEGFELLDQVRIFADPDWKRGVSFDLNATLKRFDLKRSDFDLILEKPDPTNWLMWQLGKLVPRLQWNQEWDLLASDLHLDPTRPCIGVHVQTETSYTYEKNWPESYWRAFFEKVTREHNAQVLLFGFSPTPAFDMPGIIDLRGRTNLHTMLSLIKNRCEYLVVPDSGVLSLTYYLNCVFALKAVSLWADPRQGVLKQNVASPNRELIHIPLIAPKEDLRNIAVERVVKALFSPKVKR